ncbi:ubiquitin-like modifier-activating enzyme 7 isoform X1 [Meleagris gallopavo]|uniref:ubiquitin-like modifier-activating enzyme 7 isoform X1 n=1 Tax=Meleagris gallopavo TaxID=9103 RepID=UPI000549CA45|nr:ubiquitin-like modifier-activating enzyme 7 isoform X1 [Meleagris gallopavo]
MPAAAQLQAAQPPHDPPASVPCSPVLCHSLRAAWMHLAPCQDRGCCSGALCPSVPICAQHPALGLPVLLRDASCWDVYRGKEWSCWDRLEVRAIGEDGQAMTVRELLAWLQEEHRWTVTKLLRGSTMLYDGEEDEETRARQQAQRLSDGVERSAEPQQLELQYVCAGDELEDACPPLLCTLP